MAYTFLTTYFKNLNKFENIINTLSIHINLLHKTLNLVLIYTLTFKFCEKNSVYIPQFYYRSVITTDHQYQKLLV